MLVSSTSWVTLSTLALSVLAAPPTVKDGYFTTVQFDAGQLINIAVFKMDFDQDLFMKKASDNSRTELKNMLNITTGEFPDLSYAGIDVVSVNCGQNLVIPSNFAPQNGQQNNGPPQGYITSPPTADPAASLLNIIFKGIKVDEAIIPNRYALAYPLPPNFPMMGLATMNCTAQFNTNKPYALSNKDGEMVSSSFTLRYQPPRCDYKEVQEMIEFGKKVFELATEVDTSEEMGSFVNLMNSVTAREAFEGCKRVVSSWMTYKNSTVTVTGNTQCMYRFDDPEWKTDPCCNHELLQTQCCKPRSVTFPAKVIDSVNTNKFSGICKNPTKISGLLSNVIDAMKGESQEPFDFFKYFQTYTSFLQTCSNSVFNQQCTSDADCPYSGLCGQNSKCFVDYTNPGPAFIKCSLSKMSDDLKLEFKAMLGLPTRYNDTQEEITQMSARILQEAETEDCAGPESDQYRKRITYQRDKEGRYQRIETPGNQTGCLQPKECSYEPWNRNTQAKCTQDSTYGRTNFCAQCRQGFCNPITQFSRCYNYQVTSQYCSAQSGIYEPQSQTCTFPSKNTEALCLTGPQCRNSNEPWRCDRTVCINTQITQIQNCNGNYRWDWGLEKCILNESVFQNNQANCNGAGLTYAPGIRFDAGRYDTQAKCPSTSCDNFQVIWRGGNETDCKNQGYCTSPCSRCRSFSYDDGACRNTTSTTLDDCNIIGGKWLNQGGSNACIVQRTQSTCSGDQLLWIDCNSLSESTCTSSPFSQVLGCQWSRWDSCKNPATCAAAGFCDDWEFGNSQGDGACIFKPSQPYQCDGAAATRNGWCIDRQVTAQNQCTAPKVWRTRAKTKEQCAAQGTFCELENGQRTFMNSTACAECGGKSLNVYDWNTPRWIYGNMVNTTWEPIEWRSKNKWIKVLDFDKLQSMLNSAAARFMSRVLVNRFSERYSVYATIFKYASCDCFGNRNDCFGEGPIKARLKECKADPASATSCGGVNVQTGMFPNGTAVSIEVNLVSSATFIKDGTTLMKRAVQSTAYEVVKNGDESVIGQIVGNGKQFTFGTTAISDVQICLDVDPSISQDAAKYTNRDFAQSINGTLSVPLKRNVTLVGTQYCGTVPAFKDGTFVPVLRNNATIIQRSTATTTTSTTATGTRNPNSAYKGQFNTLWITLLSFFALL